uniref:Candidate secreted effector n=1 Tax=Meloidogyne incognita TaxID=6306 RepID=A0A914KII6_MELIC
MGKNSGEILKLSEEAEGSDADSDIQVLYEADASNVMQELDSGFSFFIDTSCSDSCEKDSPSTTNGILNSSNILSHLIETPSSDSTPKNNNRRSDRVINFFQLKNLLGLF